MAPAPKLGDEILLPLFDESALGPPSTVTWSQGLSTRTAPYYAPDVDNITTGEQVQAFFIAAELYKPSTTSNPKHITKVGTLVPGEGYKIKIDSAMQYGQKNAKGDMRFIVYHDKEREPYQHRFLETALGSMAVDKAKLIVERLGQGAIGGEISSLLKNIVGDYLRTF